MTAADAVEAKLWAYPTYKDSGVPWIGEIPTEWEVRRIRQVMQLNPRKTEKTLPDEVSFVPMDAVSEDGQMDSSMSRPANEVATGYTYFREGDLVMAKITPCFENGKGAVAKTLLNEVGFGSTEFHVLRGTEHMPSSLAYYLTMTPGFRALGESHMYGAGGQKRVPTSFMRNAVFPVASPVEQQAIVTFLDRETARIDELLLEQARLLDDLVVKRQATITHAVTEGLNAASSVEVDLPWNQRVPATWTVVRLKNILVGIQQGWSPEGEAREAAEGEWGVLKSGCVNRGVFRPEEHKAISDDLIPRPELEVQEGDLLMSRASGSLDLIGSVALTGKTRQRLMLSDKLFRLLCDAAQISPRFLYYAMNSAYMRLQIRQAVSGAEGLANNIGKRDIGNFFCILPPLPEQQAIVDHLDHTLAQLDQLVSEVHASMELMRQHRSALITAAVTGKIDVREA